MPARFISNEGLVQLLHAATIDERLALTKLLNPSAAVPENPEILQRQISLTGGHGVANFFRGGGTGYIDIVDDVVDALKVEGVPGYYSVFKGGIRVCELDQLTWLSQAPESVKQRSDKGLRTQIYTQADVPMLTQMGHEYCALAEGKIVLKILEDAYKKMNPSEKAEFDAQVSKIAAHFDQDGGAGKLVGAAGLMVIGNLGGFATYMLMSSLLSTISFGMLGFGAYTAASSALSVMLGPLGWLALGGTAAYSLGKAELRKTIPFVATTAMIRQRLIAGR
jgi:uncharacterized protein YaaW (UPF0174 family)